MDHIGRERRKISAALGECRAELVIKNASVFNVFTECFERQDIAVTDGTIVGLGSYAGETEVDAAGLFALPGFIDGHMHLESSIVSPAQYCRAVMPHGTTTVVADPHEITNVLGKSGFSYLLAETRGLPLDVKFMVPSCVPATPFDETGAVITPEDVAELLAEPGVLGLAEVMNYPGVLSGDADVLRKLEAADGRPVDGHAPGLTGMPLNGYLAVGIRTDHECSDAAEAMEKLSRGQWIMIREGTAGKNLSRLLPLFAKPYCDRCLLVTDDKHPGELATEGHIDHILRKAIAGGADPIHAFKMASYNAAVCFGLDRVGALAPGYAADIVLAEELETVRIRAVYKRGILVDGGLPTDRPQNPYADWVCSTIRIPPLSAADFALKKPQEKVIGLVPGELLTSDEGYASAIDTGRDICKLAVLERHRGTGHIGIAFVKGYGLQRGAVATSISHDSHNVIAVGANEADMAAAVERIRLLGGGMVVVEQGRVLAELPLPIAGLMCELDVQTAGERLTRLKEAAYALGVSRGIDPFMTLSFSSLAVIPTLRLTSLGVVDVNRFRLLP